MRWSCSTLKGLIFGDEITNALPHFYYSAGLRSILRNAQHSTVRGFNILSGLFTLQGEQRLPALDRLALRPHVGDAGTGEPHPNVGRNLEFDLVLVGGLGDLADQTAAGDDRVSAPRALHQRLLVLRTPLLRP